MAQYNEDGKWYHGSPEELKVLQKGSTITQNRDLARIYSHKPSLVSVDNWERILHNGMQPGFLYEISEIVTSDDVVPHPRSTMPPGLEWIITRPLRVRLLCGTTPYPKEQLTAEETVKLMSLKR